MKEPAPILPWYMRDINGYPIESVKGRSKWLRIIFQNIRKLIG